MKKTKKVILITFAIFLLGIGSFFLFSSQKSQYELLENVITLPISLIKGLPVIIVNILDEEIPLVIDTGASEEISINLKKHSDLEVEFIKSDTINIIKDAKGNSFEVRNFIIPNLSLGKLMITNITGIEAIFDPSFAPPVDDGAIGRKLLKNYIILLDYRNSKIFLSSDRVVKNIENWKSISFESNEKGIITKCKIYDKEYNCLWDTGSTSNFIKTEIAEEILGQNIESQKKMNFLLELEDSKYQLKTDFRNIDGLPSFFDLVLGADFFKDHLTIIDLKNKKIYYN